VSQRSQNLKDVRQYEERTCVRPAAGDERGHLHGSFTFVAGLAANWDVGDQPVPAPTVGASRDDLPAERGDGQQRRFSRRRNLPLCHPTSGRLLASESGGRSRPEAVRGMPGQQVPLDCGQGRRAGSCCLGPRSVRTTLVMGGFTLVIGGFPVRKGPFGRSEERNGPQGGSACRWPQVFHTQAIRLRPMTFFNPVFNRLTPRS